MNIIEQIKAEIERRRNNARDWSNKAKYKGPHYHKMRGIESACDAILSFLATLESENPMNQEGLEEDVKSWFFNEISSKINVEHSMYYYFQECARHYYELGCRRTAEKADEIEYNRQRAEESIPNDLEEASSKFATHTASNGVSVEFLAEKLSFQEGAKWQKEQIMKNAKDGWMDEEDVIVLNDDTRIDLQPDYEKKPAFEFEYAQDVRVIILPKEN